MKIDAKGLACPQPILVVQEMLGKNPNTTVLEVEVDNRAASENVLRFLENQGYNASVVEKNNLFVITTNGQSDKLQNTASERIESNSKKCLIIITSETLGKGDDVLGKKAMCNFLKTLPEMGTSLWRICFLNGGVILCTGESPALEYIQILKEQGVSVFVCGSCLEHFQLTDKKRVGETTNMLDIVTSLDLAEKIINI